MAVWPSRKGQADIGPEHSGESRTAAYRMAIRLLLADAGAFGPKIQISHATVTLEQGIHPKIVEERLGHSTISTTLDTYSHVVPGLQQAAAMAFDDILRKDSSLDKQFAQILRKSAGPTPLSFSTVA